MKTADLVGMKDMFSDDDGPYAAKVVDEDGTIDISREVKVSSKFLGIYIRCAEERSHYVWYTQGWDVVLLDDGRRVAFPHGMLEAKEAV